MIEFVLLSIIFVGLLVGTFTDFRSREVPDWVSYGLIFLGFGLRLLYSVFYSDYSFLLNGLVGFLLFLGIGLTMFYSGQWGGGDAKLLMGLGVLMGLNLNFSNLNFSSFPFSISFFINLLFAGAIYGLFWAVFLSIKHRKKFIISFKKLSSAILIRRVRLFILISSVFLIIPVFITNSLTVRFSFIILAVLPISTLYFWLFAKSVEQSCMFKRVTPDKLTEGDWIDGDLTIGGRMVYSKKDLGVSKQQISLLRRYHSSGKIKFVTVKEGIPFVPSFLLAFIITFFFGAWFLAFL